MPMSSCEELGVGMLLQPNRIVRRVHSRSEGDDKYVRVAAADLTSRSEISV